MSLLTRAAVAVLTMNSFANAQGPMLAVSVRGDNTVNLYKLVGGGLGLTLTQSVAVGKSPGEMCLAPNGRLLFVSNVADKTVSMIDVESRTVSGTLSAADMESPDGCAVSRDSQRVYSVDQQGNSVYAFAVNSRQQLAKIAVGKEPRRAIVSPDGSRVIISNAHDNTLSVIDTAKNQVVKTVKTGTEPRDMAYSPDGNVLAVGMIEDDSVEFFTADTLEHKQECSAVRSPQHIEYSPDGQRLYVLGKISDEVGVLRITDHARLSDTIPITRGPLGVLNSWGMAMTPDGKYLFATNLGEGTISILDTQTLKTFRAVAGGKSTIAAVFIKAAGPEVGSMTQAARIERFRTLAQNAMDAVKKNDLAGASKLCETLEREWDEGEQDLRRSSPDVWNQVDEAMDEFIHPIMRAGGKQPNGTALDKTYQTFLAKLKLVK